MGGDVFVSARGIWNKVFTDRLSRRIAWASIGEGDEEGKKKIAGSQRMLYMIRQNCPHLRDLIFGM